MKKYLLILCLVSAILVSVSCSSDGGESVKEIVSTSSETENETEIVEETALSIEEQVLWEINGVKLTAKSIEEDSIWGTGIKVIAENNSDKDASFYLDALIVNDFMISDFSGISVTAGNKSNDTIYISDSELKAAGIEKIGKIEMYMHMSDPETYDRIADSDCIEIHTSLFDEMDKKSDTEGVVLLEQDGIKITGKYVDENSFWGMSALLYIENNSDQNITVRAEDVAVNGFMVSALGSQQVYAGKKAFTDIQFFSSDLEENGIESIDKIETKFIVSDDDYNRIIETDKISFDVK